jgi:hypothetical protein
VSSANVETPHKYWRVYREALDALRALDLRERASAAGYTWSPESIPTPFLGIRFAFSIPRFELELEGTPVAAAACRVEGDLLAERILVLHYLARASGVPLSGRLVGFDQLAGGMFYGVPFRKRTETPLARIFAPVPARLAEVAASLGGAPGDHGDASAIIWPFPKVPMTLIVWTGDEELPPNAKVLFDDTAEGYLSTEDIAVLGDLVIRRVKELMG